MAKQRPDKQPAQPAAAAARQAPVGWSFWARLGVSVWVVWHLFAVFISPFGVPPTSELISNLATSPWVRWYSDPAYINGGYHFFGPDPPLAGMLVRYEVTGDAGEVIAQGEFPNRANDGFSKQWPRLWYHRHMMLADQTGDVVFGLPPEENQRLALRAYARHLLRKHGGSRARIEYIEHRSLNPGEARDGVDPTSPELYRVLLSVAEDALDLGEPLLPAEYFSDESTLEATDEPLPLGFGEGVP